MATPIAPKLLTAEEFALLPNPDDGSRMELVRGIVQMAPPPGAEHGSVAVTLGSVLSEFARAHKQGRVFVETGFRLARNTVRGPDVSFVAGDFSGTGSLPRGYFEGAPTLAIEIASPNESEQAGLTKIGEYLDAGSARVWVVRPANHTVTVYRQGGDVQMYREHETLSSDDAAFDTPGFTLPVTTIFA